MYGKPEIEQVHSFAKGGAACSKKLTPRAEMPAPFLMEDEVRRRHHHIDGQEL